MQYSKKVEGQETLDYKQTQIQKSQANKENSIKIASCGRDAVLIAIATGTPEEKMKEKILEWRKWLWNEVYNDNISTPF